MKLACPNCSANVEYKIGTKSVFCPHCQAETEISSLDEKLYKTISQKTMFDSSAYTCASCGSQIITLDNQPISICNFCGSTNFSNTNIKFNINDRKLIPFKYTKEEFIKNFKVFIADNKLSNLEFFKEENIEKITGLYIPIVYNEYAMKYDAKGSYEREKRKLLNGPDNVANYDYSGLYGLNMTFDTLEEFPDYLTTNLLPYDTSESVDYSPYYFCGLSVMASTNFANKKFLDSFSKVKYFLEKSQTLGFLNGKKVLNQSNIYTITTNHSERYYVPVWLCSYKHQNETYSFAMNGQTGEIITKLPGDERKIKADLENEARKMRNIEFINHVIAFGVIIFYFIYMFSDLKATTLEFVTARNAHFNRSNLRL